MYRRSIIGKFLYFISFNWRNKLCETFHQIGEHFARKKNKTFGWNGVFWGGGGITVRKKNISFDLVRWRTVLWANSVWICFWWCAMVKGKLFLFFILFMLDLCRFLTWKTFNDFRHQSRNLRRKKEDVYVCFMKWKWWNKIENWLILHRGQQASCSLGLSGSGNGKTIVTAHIFLFIISYISHRKVARQFECHTRMFQ